MIEGEGRSMANDLRVAVEVGPKGKKVVAYAPDWPGLERGAKTPELAIERLTSYIPRYATIAQLAGMSEAFASVGEPSVVETYPGTGSTDFWGISFAFSAFDQQPVSNAELERELALMQACWTFFDEVRYRVSDELRKGPRGGGRDRENVVRHVIGAEYDWGKGIGIRALAGGRMARRCKTARLSRRVCRRHSHPSRRGQDGEKVAVALPHPPHRLPHPRSHLGNGGP